MAHENLHLSAEIEIEGQKSFSNIISLNIAQRMDWHHTFEVKLRLSVVEDDRAISLDSSQQFVGKEIKIALKSQGGSDQLNFFKGIVTNVSLSRHGGNASDLVISGHSSSILLDDGPNCSTHLEKSLKQVISMVASAYPTNLISVKCAPTVDPMFPYQTQYNESAYQFIGRLANTYGQWFFYNGTEMIFGAPAGGQPIEMSFGHDLESFDLSMKVIPLSFETGSYDYVNNEALISEASTSGISQNNWGSTAISNSKSLFSHSTFFHNKELVKDQSELSAIAENRVGARAGDLVVMSGTSDNPRLKIGSKINVVGARSASLSSDKTDYGIYIITGVTHRLDGLGGYQNQFTAIPADLKVPPHNKNFRRPQIDHQMAVVLDNKDPDGFGRIKVRMYWQDENASTNWIRYVASHAGKDRGFYMIPEINDEVVIAFENGNLNMPFAIGSMFHGQGNSGDKSDNDNYVKAIRTVSGNEILFSDKGGEEYIHIFTSGKKNEVLISMKDDGMIQITSNKMIKIEAKADIEVKAKNMNFSAEENISFKAKEFKVAAQKLVQIESTQDLKLKGATVATEAVQSYALKSNTSIELKAGTTFEASGMAKVTVKSSAMLELSGSAMATLKGAMVMIN